MSKPNRREFDVYSTFSRSFSSSFSFVCLAGVLCENLWGSKAHTLNAVCRIFILFRFIRSTCLTQLFKLKFIAAYGMNWIYSVIWIYKKGTLGTRLSLLKFACMLLLLFYPLVDTLKRFPFFSSVDFWEIGFELPIQVLPQQLLRSVELRTLSELENRLSLLSIFWIPKILFL